jgi:hypothetical protein
LETYIQVVHFGTNTRIDNGRKQRAFGQRTQASERTELGNVHLPARDETIKSTAAERAASRTKKDSFFTDKPKFTQEGIGGKPLNSETAHEQ